MVKEVTTDKRQEKNKRQDQDYNKGYRPRSSQLPPKRGKSNSEGPVQQESGSRKGKKK